MKKLLLAVLVLLPVSVSAQTNPVPVGRALIVTFDHDGVGAPTSFRCALDGLQVGSDLAASARNCAIPSVTTGAHTVTITAVNAFGTTPSAPLTATGGTAPSAPTNLRISMQIAVNVDGTAELLAFNVEKQ